MGDGLQQVGVMVSVGKASERFPQTPLIGIAVNGRMHQNEKMTPCEGEEVLRYSLTCVRTHTLSHTFVLYMHTYTHMFYTCAHILHMHSCTQTHANG